MRLPRRSAAVLLVALFAPAIAGAQGVAAGAVLRGKVVAKDGDLPLEHAMVTIQPAQRQTFSQDDGTFAVGGLLPGDYRVRVAHLGYVATEVSVTVPAEGQPAPLKIELQLVSVSLPAMKVLASWACKNPGPPDAATDPEFAAVIGQLKLNAEQYRLLADSFPFAYRFRRVVRPMAPDSTSWVRKIDTVTFTSNDLGWRYEPGNVVDMDKNHEPEMRIPTLGDFASDNFLTSHCFRYAGRDVTKDGPVLRIEFIAADALKTPDVNGMILLDAGSFQIRRATLKLSSIPRSLPGLRSLRVETSFAEIAPYIIVFNEIEGTNTMIPYDGQFIASTTELQTLFQFVWLRSAPGKTGSPPQ